MDENLLIICQWADSGSATPIGLWTLADIYAMTVRTVSRVQQNWGLFHGNKVDSENVNFEGV